MDFIVAIPARFASQRLHGKPLRALKGKPMIHHVVDRALESGAQQVVVATDAPRVAEKLKGLDCEVCMTSTRHRSGTERLAECARLMGWPDHRIVVNLQGDEPLLPGAWLRQAAADLESHESASIATLCTPITRRDDVFNPNVVKVVLDVRGDALYFSRAAVPWHRDDFRHPNRSLAAGIPWFRHIGVYAYRAGFLREFAERAPSPLERAESLEQLRALEHGYRIHVRVLEAPVPPSVDTEEDLHSVETIMKQL